MKTAIVAFFSIWVFFHEHSRFTGQQGKGQVICLTPLYHYYPLCRHWNISRATTAEISPLHIASSRTQTRNLWLPITSTHATCYTPSACTPPLHKLFQNSNCRYFHLQGWLLEHLLSLLFRRIYSLNFLFGVL